jgi:hypothetical protein
MVVDLVSPSGRIGTPMDPNDYSVEVFLDAVTKAEIAFRMDEPGVAFGPTASDVLALMLDGGLACAEPESATGGRTSVTCLTAGAPRDVGTETITTFDAADVVTSMTVSRAIPAPAIEDELRQFAAAVLGFAVDALIAVDVREWIATAAPGTSTRIGGVELEFSEEPGDAPRLSFEARIPA